MGIHPGKMRSDKMKNHSLQYPIYITKLRDLKPGDLLTFFGNPQYPVNRSQRDDTWYHSEYGHSAIVGEVYDDKIVIYDGGRFFIGTNNFKRVIKRPQNDSEEYSKIFDYIDWAAERYIELK